MKGHPPSEQRGLARCRVRFGAAALLLSTVVVLASSPAGAQLSPGELSRAHAGLEGSAHCLDCHHSKRGVDRGRCLDCHKPLAERIEAGLGLHAQSGYGRCETCHIEHHGIDFELVWWGEEGREGFEHERTGYPLEGAHRSAGREAGCRVCHRPEHIRDSGDLVRAGKDLGRTFLGLSAECLSCHIDEHRGQVAADSCLSCHDLEAWVPAPGFDHAETRFPLTGSHREVVCTGCHKTLESGAPATDRRSIEFRVERFTACSDCHRDPHEGRLGSECSRCHTTDGWVGFDRSAFDHDRTRFSLRGAHRTVGCDGCHRSGRGFRVARFARCVDCHTDPHLGQLDALMLDEGCPACHSVERFTPAEYSLEAHQASAYPLEGAHLAVPCLSCHREIPFQELRRHWEVASSGVSDRARQFRFRGTACVDCHQDPHEGEVERWRGESGCGSCHALSTWTEVTFDHARTEFPLEGGHRDVACEGCHPRAAEAGAEGPIRMTGASMLCSSCHEDPHAGQFESRGSAACAGCHGVESWKKVVFDHDLDSRFPLVGAHEEVPCASCHLVEVGGDGRQFVRYRPRETACEACHS